MGFATTFATLSFIIVFIGATVFFLTTQHALTASATEIKEEQARIIGQQHQDITILSTTYQVTPLRDWTTVTASDFAQGTFNLTQAVGEDVELATGESAGTYSSLEYDTGVASNFDTLSFSSIEPGGSSVEFQIRSADTQNNLLLASYLGPDGTSGTTYSTTGTAINAIHDGDQWVQFRSYLSAAGQNRPTLTSVAIGIIRQTNETVFEIENTGKSKLNFEATDVYEEQSRFLRSEANRYLIWDIGWDDQLWNPGEVLNISVYTNFAGTRAFTVANEYAKDFTMVSS